MPDFYNLDALSKTAVNLFYGWGYNFYRVENQLRADDLLIRAKIGWLLGRAQASVAAAEAAYRREFLPPPSRAKPYPDAAAVAGAQAIERLGQAIVALEGQIRAQPVPENDRMTQLYRREAETLTRLLVTDQKLAGQAEMLREMLDGKDGAWVIANVAEAGEGLKAMGATLAERQGLLFGM
jgi:hypothetical protein